MKKASTGPVFDAYAHYYDLLYRDKDYRGEADYVRGLIRRHRPGAKRVLELGSGTGRHAQLLASRGLVVHGIERSEVMLAGARRSLPPRLAGSVTYTQGDIRSFRIKGRFDAVISLFHVISYLTTNEDLLATFRRVRRHLVPGGVFVFDFWYGPAVLTERPAVRVKRLADERVEVTRVAEPRLDTERSLVEVNYELFLRHRADGRVETIRETHLMRYLFLPEVGHLLAQAGLKLAHAEEWLTARPVAPATWGVCVVAQG